MNEPSMSLQEMIARCQELDKKINEISNKRNEVINSILRVLKNFDISLDDLAQALV